MRAYRICPCPMFDIGGTQRWLEQMSAKGFHIDTAFNWRIVGFEKGEPKPVRYRMDAAPDWGKGTERGTPGPTWGTYLSYQEMGWEYVSNRNHFHIYAAEDPNAPELHTDPRIQAMSLKLVSRRLFRSILGIIPLVLLWFYYFSSFDTYGSLISGEVNFPLITVLAYGMLLIQSITEYLWVHRLRKGLDHGQSIQPFSPGARFFALFLEVMPVVMILLMLGSFTPSVREQAEGIPPEEYAGTLAVPTVQELLPNAEFTEVESLVYPWQTAASPENYQFRQSFDLVLPDGSEISGSWSVTRHETAAPWIALGYAKECVAHDEDRWIIEPLPLEAEADFAAAYRIQFNSRMEPNAPTVILCQGNSVLIASLDCDKGTQIVDYRVLAALLGEYLY